MNNAYKRVKNAGELLEFLQTLSPEELALPLFRSDNAPDYGPFYDEIEEVSIMSVCVDGWKNPTRFGLIF